MKSANKPTNNSRRAAMYALVAAAGSFVLFLILSDTNLGLMILDFWFCGLLKSISTNLLKEKPFLKNKSIIIENLVPHFSFISSYIAMIVNHEGTNGNRLFTSGCRF